MEHWFDGLTRRFAHEPQSRRAMLAWTAKLGLAVAGGGLFGRNPSVASALGAQDFGASTLGARALGAAQAGPSCTAEDTYGVLKSVLSTTSADPQESFTVSHTFLAEVGSGMTSSTLLVTSGDELIRRTSTTSSPSGIASVSTVYGPRYAAVPGAHFTTDGRTVRASFDGRPTVTVPLATEFRGRKFGDVDVAPNRTGVPSRRGAAADSNTSTTAVARTAPGLDKLMTRVLQDVRTQPATCPVSRQAARVVSACTSCQLGCRDAWLNCSLEAMQASLACGSFESACYLKAVATTCDPILQTCFRTCKSSGTCCPDYCIGDAACCQSAWGCCPPSSHSSRVWSRSWPTCPRCGPPATVIRGPAPPLHG